ncbi:Trimethylguanosine synthase [Hondaea fermentalgiana]|uniref:Trimethylguanosine synthase n=1 Tax=Hondaea fermentalgiana TaxID=2315210 RepID=A0A2R5G7H2_9STRA|nr:Trimethylguanosine synthase [Hondaea fermentalgiana]|eukprot:GBG26279.1 Trimethylguanosine synthase [Hondaea fermentalgiana]
MAAPARGSVLLRCDRPLRVELEDGARLEGVVLTLDPETALVYLLEPPGAVSVFAHVDCAGAEDLAEDHAVWAWWEDLQAKARSRREETEAALGAVQGLDPAQCKALASMPVRVSENEVALFAENVLALEVSPAGALECKAPRRGVDARLENLLFDANNEALTGTKNAKKKSKGSKRNKQQTAAKIESGPLGELRFDQKRALGPDCTLYQTQVALPRYSAFAPGVTNMGAGDFHPDSGVPRKYFAQRYRLFSRFDEGIKMDQESWYSVTPESIAEHIAERCRSNIVVDAFAGAGGNAIQFAFTCEHVIAIEIDRERLEMARHNARVYGVEDRIEFILGDAIQILAMLAERGTPVDAIFISPPWGGPAYQNVDAFLFEHIRVNDLDCTALFHAAARVSPNVAIYVPRNTALNECARLGVKRVEFEQHVIDERVKTCCIYTGDLLAKHTLGLLREMAESDAPEETLQICEEQTQ